MPHERTRQVGLESRAQRRAELGSFINPDHGAEAHQHKLDDYRGETYFSLSIKDRKQYGKKEREGRWRGTEGDMAPPSTLVEITPLHASGSVGSLKQMVSF